MADGFRIPFQEAESEFVEKRSRFISRVWRVETEEEAQARIQETKKKYYDARHNCWCYLLGRIWCATPTTESLRERRDSPC